MSDHRRHASDDFFSPLGGVEMIGRPGNLRENNATIPVALFKASAMLSAHNLQIERMAAAGLRAVCKTPEVDRGRQNRPCYRAPDARVADGRACIGEAGAHRVVFYKTLRAHKLSGHVGPVDAEG
jgi:hypothetical protein